jgi:Domain of unknown function (DUF4397)
MKKFLALPLALLAGVFTTAHAQSTNVYLYFVHGIPGNATGAVNPDYPVDVSVNGVCTIHGAHFGDVLGPYSFTAGTESVAISAANTTSPCSNTAVISGSVNLSSGGNAVLEAVLENGTPSAYINVLDLSPVPNSQDRAVVFNAADAPSLTVNFLNSTGGTTSATAPTGSYGEATLYTGQTYTASAWQGSSLDASDPAPIYGQNRYVTAVFVVGSSAQGAMKILTRQIPLVY